MKKKLTSDTEAVTSHPHSQNFETAAAELEKIITSMEAGQMPLEDALSAYKRGVELLQYCQNILKNSQQQIKILEADMLKNFSLTERDAP